MRLKAKGFDRAGKFGFVFPGTNATLMKEKAADMVKEDPPEPKMTIGPISAKGEISMSFNQDMVAPSGIS